MMHSIPFSETGYFSQTICDYLEQKPSIRPFYGEFPNQAGFVKQLAKKRNSFSPKTRSILVERLMAQSNDISLTKNSLNNIEALQNESTFTVTTGHQLNLFTGPLYFIYKIVSAIKLANNLKAVHPTCHFVPVYWMASEDHDFDEICFFNAKRKKIKWNTPAQGAVGRMSTQAIAETVAVVAEELGDSRQAQHLIQLYTKAYTTFETLGAAHRYLVNELFGKYGLVIIDGDDAALKRVFIPQIKNELNLQQSFTEVQQTIETLSKTYPIQVNPREINLFYLRANYRERLVKTANGFASVDSTYQWSNEEILAEVEGHPERFSPNVIMRPLYQEVILPNLCYIGGGGELAYWFELKSFFDSQNIPFPILLLRNSVLCIAKKESKKMKKLALRPEDLFLDQHVLLAKKTKELSEINIDFSPQRNHLIAQFEQLEALAEKTDKSFTGAVRAQKKKQLNGLDHLEKRLLKAQKRKLSEQLDRITRLQDALFPKHSLAERYENFSTAILDFGEDFIDTLVGVLDPLSLEFTVLTMDN